jgi:hypothetical protein
MYLYDTTGPSINRMTTGLTQVADVLWSPAGTYVAHKAVSDIGIERSGPPLIVSAIWITDTRTARSVLAREGQGQFAAWTRKPSLITYRSELGCGSFALAEFSINGLSNISLWADTFHAVAVDPDTGAVLLGNTYSPTSPPIICDSVHQDGLYLLGGAETPPQRVADYDISHYAEYPPIVWSPEARQFFFDSSGGVTTVDTAGVIGHPQNHLLALPSVSPSGDIILVSGDGILFSGLWLIRSGQPDHLIDPEGACRISWKPDSSGFFFASDESLFLSEEPTFKPTLVLTGQSGLCHSHPEWVMP